MTHKWKKNKCFNVAAPIEEIEMDVLVDSRIEKYSLLVNWHQLDGMEASLIQAEFNG